MGCVYEQDEVRLDPMNRGILFADLPRYFGWMQSQEVTKYNSHGLFVKSRKDLDAWMDSVEAGTDNVTFAIHYRHEWVGVCSLQAINWVNRSAEVAIYVGDPAVWGKGVASISVDLLLQHAFHRLGMNRVWSGTAATNAGMNRVFTKLGFKKEGVFRDGMFLGGEFVDVNSYGILAEEWFED